MRGNHLSIGQRVEHWLYTYSRLRNIRTGRSPLTESAPHRSHSADTPIQTELSRQALWQALTDGFRKDRLNATHEFLSRQQYFRTVRHIGSCEWMQNEEVEIAPSLDVHDLYARLDSSARAEGLAVEGLTLTLVVIDENGTPREAAIQESEHPLLNTKALYTAMRTPFSPAHHYGVPVGTIAVIPLYFSMPDNAPAT